MAKRTVSAHVPDSSERAAAQAAPALAETPERQDHLEAIIRIIMDATGFTRDEIQPEMDLRRDLSIRSSRLPIIMDAAERHFGITIELEDFIHVRTVRDIAQRISAIVARQEGPEPMLLAWFDRARGLFSPNITCCREDKPSWLTYAESRGGDIVIMLNDLDYVFVFRRLTD